MWVEISKNDRSWRAPSHPLREDVSWNTLSYTSKTEHPSSSSWGCELKYFHLCVNFWHISHPLREDVSWNTPWGVHTHRCEVILFVRMWVEIKLKPGAFPWLQSSSSWGCELKYVWCCDLVNRVGHPLREDVSWNKLWLDNSSTGSNRHPLREDVSWNSVDYAAKSNKPVILFVRMWVEMLYAAS